MGFIKVVKNKAYFKRYQTKYRRRRECRTDYCARRKLIAQDKNKYASPKYRFVVRITNKDIICQVFSSDLTHDVCVASAYSHELDRYGVKVGLTNYSAAYCTGLLLARRINAKFGLDYQGIGNEEEAGDDYEAGDYFNVYDTYEERVADGEKVKAPFKALLDVGLRRTTTGCRLFGALKGACDGGISIPHNTRRFPGSKKVDGEWENDASVHADYIFGQHIAKYMKLLQEQDEEVYKKRFSQYIANGIGPDDIYEMYEDAHEQIRADPNKARDALKLGNNKTRKAAREGEVKKVSYKRARMSVSQRLDRVRQKMKSMN
jgi:large subunit ribosomal protein L5e